jgi:hypothetical protein
MTTFSVIKNGVDKVWEHDMRIVRVYGSSISSPTPVPISLYLTLSADDWLNFTFANASDGISQISSGTTLNITGLAIGLNSSKTFVIDHPQDTNKYLVHACLEGPEAGVYYRGTARVESDECRFVEVKLPRYVNALAYNFTVSVSHIIDENNDTVSKLYGTTQVKNNSFKIYGPKGNVFWHVYGTRQTIEVEPLKSSTTVKGSGPYKWL